MSDIQDAIRGMSFDRRPRKPGAVARWGLLDLVLVALALLAVGSRTPIGGIFFYGMARLSGDNLAVPGLTAYFSNGGAAPPLELMAEVPTGPATHDGLPEPWRTAARTMLAQAVPTSMVGVLEARGRAVTPETAMEELDTLWKLNRDAGLVLEVAAIGADQRARAVGRAVAAGEPDPESYEGHRRYLSGTAVREADRFVGGALALATALDLGWPLTAKHSMTSPYGERLHPTLGVRKFHDGVDLGVPIGTPVLAAQDATVAVVGESSASGRYVILDHGNGVKTSYCHLNTTPVRQGAAVRKGETFALSGNTGRSTGPHLHYGIKIAGRWVDPTRFRR